MKFTKNAEGQIVCTEQDLTAYAGEVAAEAVKQTEEKFSRVLSSIVPTPPVAGEDSKSFARPAVENRTEKVLRLNNAAVAVSGGTLAVAKAPKEIKAFRYFEALSRKDTAVMQELGEGSWGPRGKALSIAVAADGGNLVPVEFATDLKVAMEEYTSIGDCAYHSMTTNEKDLRAVQTKPVIYQVDEGAALTGSAAKFSKPILTAKAFAGYQVMSKEFFSDNNVNAYDKLVALFGEAFAARKSKEMFVGQTFTGILDLSLATVRETLASVSIKDITYKNLVNMSVALSNGQLMNRGKWYMHRTVWGICLGITDDNGRPITTNPWDPLTRSLLGFPIQLDEQINGVAADAANKGFIAFGNMEWLDYGEREGITAQLMHEGTFGAVSLAETRQMALVLDTRFGFNASLPANVGVIATKA